MKKTIKSIANEVIDLEINALKKLKVTDDLYNFAELSKSSILTLAENKITTLFIMQI